MATLWNKGKSATEAVETFTVGNDRALDLRLAQYDVKGSLAHIKMLESIGLLSKEELETLTEALNGILGEIQAGTFVLEDDVEDIHSEVELLLTRRLGDVGKKIHSGRSRNDQVALDVKLFFRDEILKIRAEVLTLFKTLQGLSERYKDVLIPGYTHGQIAMPSSFGLWFGAYAEQLADDMFLLSGAWKVADCNPLGSAAGYGNSFPLDRKMTTELLGFGELEYNSVSCQLSRGKTEKAVASAIGSIALTLNRFAADCCLYMCPNFGFIRFPDELTTGSSIMPHKKNPDVWEIMRGQCNRIMAAENTITMLCSNLQHGYHRDLQLLKDILFPALELTHSCLGMADYMLRNIEVREGILDEPLYDNIFTVEEVNRRTLKGKPFRDAYREVGIEVNEGRFRPDKTLHHTHEGSVGNLCTEEIAEKMSRASAFAQND